MSRKEYSEFLELKLLSERKKNRDLEEKVERLTGLLKDCRPYVAGWTEAIELWDGIKKEVSGERQD